jgi:SNF2 family DNA or RNA helicase
MIKILKNRETDTKVNVVWTCANRNNHYSIQSIIKSFIGSYQKDRIWRVSMDDLNDLVIKLRKLDGETIHVDLAVFQILFTQFAQRTEILALRERLDGVDSGIVLKNNFKLLPFQHVGVEFISQVKNGLIADKVGLGKTIQGICGTYKMFLNKEIEKCIIIVPSTIKVKWGRDIEKFLGLKATLLEGAPDKRSEMYRRWMAGAGSDFLYMIVSYDTIKRDMEKYVQPYTRKKFAIIMDEVQRIKNVPTERSKACRLLSENRLCAARVGLSATYIETGLQDLFGVMLVVDETVFGNNFVSFENNFLVLNWMGKVVNYKNIDIATNRMKYKSVRRNKEQVKDQLHAFLPKVNESTVWVELSPTQKKLEKDILKKTVDSIKNMEKAGKINMTTALTELGYLRQVAISAEMIDEESKESSKIEALKEMLPEIIEEHKVMIFCFYTKFIDIMERELNAIGIKTIAMHGQRMEGDAKNRQRYVDFFEKSKDVNVLLTSDILSEGIDLPFATYVINTDLHWNPARMIQRCGRIDRLNQTAENIYMVNILAQETIENQMLEVVYQRTEIANQVIDGGAVEKRIQKFSFSDIKTMLRKLGGKL